MLLSKFKLKKLDRSKNRLLRRTNEELRWSLKPQTALKHRFLNFYAVHTLEGSGSIQLLNGAPEYDSKGKRLAYLTAEAAIKASQR